MERHTIFSEPLRAVNIGARLLGEALSEQDVDVIHLNWHPPRKVCLSSDILAILEKME